MNVSFSNIIKVTLVLAIPVIATLYFAAEDWFNMLAILLGPVIAVIMTRIIDDSRAEQSRRLDIFRTLMRTRKMPIHVDHVGALNLIEVEFIENKKVITAWKEYLKNLGEDLPAIEQKDKYDAALKKRDSLLTKLISEIAKILNIRIEQLDILEGNYIPQGWHDDDLEQRIVRRSLLNILTGRAPILIRPDQATKINNPYPPVPAND
ncbi:MAG TPA: hypothetical protein DIV86_00620 [Alphaproteobacteria bacterium]|nr:hypothetical protein [Alphaproteobacteria bacterium]